MLNQWRTIRARLAMVSLTISGIILVAVCLIVLAVRERDLLEDFEDRLAEHAEHVIAGLTEHSAETPGSTVRHPASPADRSMSPNQVPERPASLGRPAMYYVQVVADSGEIRYRSSSLGNTALPHAAELLDQVRKQGRGLHTIACPEALSTGCEPPLRMLTHMQRDNGRAMFVQVAATLQGVRRSISELRQLLLILVPAGLLLLAAGAWFLARQALSPIAQIVHQARELTASRLDRRIAVPPGGDEITQLTVTINQMLDRLERAFRAHERFIANASHELQTPISVVLGEAQVLRQQPRSPDAYDAFVSSVEEEMRSMAQLVDSLLTLSRAEAGEPIAKDAVASINEVVTGAVQRCQPLAGQRGVSLVTRLALPEAGTGDPSVAGDSELLRVMLANLIRNAVRHSPAAAAVDIHVELQPASVLMTVEDRGPGVLAENLEQVFDAFLSLAPPGQSPPGAGLGLTIARAVARLHGGDICARNRPQGGCCFSVRLPRAIELDQA